MDDDDGRPAPRAKLLCSFGGTFLPRPLDGKLRYVGGETRILSLPLPALSADLLARVAHLFPAARSLKYQPPDEDLDSLVSLLDDADVANMLDEHHRLRQAAPIPARIRLFAFADPSEHEAALLRPRFDADQREVERQYIDALNSTFTPPDGFPGDLGRRYEWDGHRRSYGSPQLQFDCRFASSRPDEQFEYGGFHVGSPYSMNGHFGQLLPSGYYESAHFGLDRGNEPYNYHGYDSGPRHGNGGWGYGADGIYQVPYGSGSIHAPTDHVHGSSQSGLIRERPAQILQTNLAVNFNYNQSIPGGNLGSSRVRVEERFVNPQVGFHDNVPLHVEGFGAHVHGHEVRTPELNINKVKLENLRSSSLAHGQYQSGREGGYGAWGPVHLPTSPPSIVANRPMVAMSFVEQPSQYVSEANFQSKDNQPETAEDTHESRSLYREFLGKEPAEYDDEGSNLLVYNKLDAPCLDGNGKYPMPELIDALALEGSDEGECPTQPESNVKLSDDPSKIGPLSPHLESQGVPNDYEVCTNGDQAVVAKIEPTAAEAEAIQKGLQTIRNDDLEEVSALGTGTYGAVYHGKWKGCDVAIKRIKASCFAGKPSERERLIADFWKEALILSSLHHPNVLTFYGIVRDAPDGNLATVTEFMVNGSLKKFLQKKDRTIDRRKRLIIARDVAFGMEYLHGKNIVHFDLKCANLLVNMRDPHRPICKIGDLGLSKVKQHTFVSGGVRGTLPWMAPELLSGRSNRVSEKVDVYSFGIVLWELLTGEEPYTEMHCASVIGGIINGTLRPQIPAWCDPEWRSLMVSCWSTEPRERPSFSEISQKLRKMAEAINLK